MCRMTYAVKRNFKKVDYGHLILKYEVIHDALKGIKTTIANAISAILAIPAIWALTGIKLKILKLRRFFQRY